MRHLDDPRRTNDSSGPSLNASGLVALLILAGTLTVLLRVLQGPDPVIRSQLIVLTIACVAPLIAAAVSRRVDAFSPLVLISVVFTFLYAVRGWSLYYDHTVGVNVSGRIAQAYAGEFGPTIRLSILTVLAFYAGYAWSVSGGVGKSLPRLPSVLDRDRIPAVAITTTLVGIVCSILVVARGAGGADVGGGSLVAEPLVNGAALGSVGLGLLGVAARNTTGGARRTRIGLLVLSALILMILGFVAAEKATVLFTMIGLASAVHFGIRPIRIRELLIGVVLFALIFPPIQTLRRIMVPIGHPTLAVGITEVPSRLGQYEASSGAPRTGPFVRSYAVDVAASFSQRLFGIDALMISRALTPDVYPYLHGSTYERLPAAFVPRVLWRGKPTLSLGTFFADRYWGRATANDTSFQTVSFAGEMFLNFGVVGIAGGMFLLGFMYRIWYTWLSRTWSVLAIGLYVASIPTMLQIEGDFVLLFRTAVNRIGFTLVALIIINAAFDRRLRPGAAGVSPSDVTWPAHR